MKFIKYPNGRVWRFNETHYIKGTVLVPNFQNIDDLETQLDAISEAATGSIIGLSGFSHQHLGNDIVFFSGQAEVLPALLGESDDGPLDAEGCVILNADSPELVAALAAQYSVDIGTAKHMLSSLDVDFDDETIIQIFASGRKIHVPAHPSECDYIRIVIDGYEIAYWNYEEWHQAPQEVMGAIIGALRSRPDQ